MVAPGVAMGLVRLFSLPVLLVVLSGFSPASGCARACSGGCRAGGSTAARTGARGADDLALRVPSGRLGTRPMVVPGAAGELGERSMLASLDDAVAALPPAQGPASALAGVPSTSGKVLVAPPGARSFADDYARSLDAAGVTRHQHERLLDAFDAAQTALDATATATAPTTAPTAEPAPVPIDDASMRRINERVRLVRAARELDARMREVLDEAQLARLYEALGTSRVIAYRLSRERPLR